MSTVDHIVLWGGILVMFVGVAFGGCLMAEASRESHINSVLWERFSRARDCRVVSYEERGYRPDARTGYLCNDGITYYRVTE